MAAARREDDKPRSKISSYIFGIYRSLKALFTKLMILS